MLTAKELLDVLSKHDIRFFTGVSDSTLKDFLAYLNTRGQDLVHVPATNEGQAIGIAAGHHLATGKMPLVYLQNAGLGNTVNPLTSLTHKSVYAVPMLLFVGWRAEPGTKDEPQHYKMGEITCKLLELLDVPYEIVESDLAGFEQQVKRLKERSMKESSPVALVIRRGIFSEEPEGEFPEGLKREEALRILLEKVGADPVAFVSTTGKTARELFELRNARSEGHERDFLVVGSMGCASAIALGIALARPEKKVCILDGDGAALMHMGSLPTIGHWAPKNLCHVLLDNGVHESTGGQPTVSPTVDWEQIFRASGYREVMRARTKEELAAISLQDWEGPVALIVNVAPGSRKDLSRPAQSPDECKKIFMDFIQKPHA